MHNVMFTVITICLNSEKEISKTMKSVMMQKDVNVEYIIKDGNSSDRTNLLVEELIENNINDSINIKHIVSDDEGIYSAMNQAIKMASGEWIIFMNSGDCFYDSEVLRDIYKHINQVTADVVFGDTVYSLDDEHFFVQIHGISEMDKFFSIGHQSTFVRTNIMKKNMFDESYKISGDYDFFMRMLDKQVGFRHVNMIISICNREGVSSRKKEIMYKEDVRIRKKCSAIEYYRGLFIWHIKAMLVKAFPRWEKYRFCKNNMKRFKKIIEHNNSIIR